MVAILLTLSHVLTYSFVIKISSSMTGSSLWRICDNEPGVHMKEDVDNIIFMFNSKYDQRITNTETALYKSSLLWSDISWLRVESCPGRHLTHSTEIISLHLPTTTQGRTPVQIQTSNELFIIAIPILSHHTMFIILYLDWSPVLVYTS